MQQSACFLDGHGEPDPFSLESHDHTEGAGGHSHGLGAQTILHERHGMAKARHGLETMNYSVKKVLLMQADDSLSKCNILIVAGPKSALLPGEVQAIDRYLADGGNALFMLDPFIQTGLEPIVEEFGVVLDDTMVIDSASHFWTDVSAPAVTDYNRHEITRDLPLTLLPRRALVVAYDAARARRFGQAGRQLLQGELRRHQPRRRLSSTRRRTSPDRPRSW